MRYMHWDWTAYLKCPVSRVEAIARLAEEDAQRMAEANKE